MKRGCFKNVVLVGLIEEEFEQALAGNGGEGPRYVGAEHPTKALVQE